MNGTLPLALLSGSEALSPVEKRDSCGPSHGGRGMGEIQRNHQGTTSPTLRALGDQRPAASLCRLKGQIESSGQVRL